MFRSSLLATTFYKQNSSGTHISCFFVLCFCACVWVSEFACTEYISAVVRMFHSSCWLGVCGWFFICMLCDWHCACVFACMLRHKEGPNILQLQKKLKVLPVQIQSIESFLFVAWPGIPLQKPCVLWVHCWVSYLCAMVMIVPHETSFAMSFFTWKILFYKLLFDVLLTILNLSHV